MQDKDDEPKKQVFDSDSEGEVVIEKEKSPAPVDKFHLIYFIYLLQGIGILLPWNAFISNPTYFKAAYHKFPSIITYFGAVYTVTNLLGTVGNTFLVGLITLKKRIIISQIICFIFLLVPPALSYIPMGQIPSFVLLLLSLAVIGFASAIFQGSMFGMADMLPPVYTQALMSGNGAAGVLVSVLTAVLEAIFSPNPDSDSSSSSQQGATSQQRLRDLIYFIIGSSILLFCIIGYLVMLKNDFMNYYLAQHEVHVSEDEETPLVTNSVNSETETITKKASPFVVARKIWRMELSVCSVFWVSLAIFPGLAETNICAPNIGSNWFPIIMINLFNIFDFIGRSLPRWFVLISENKLGYFVFVRIIFLPLFILCCKTSYWDSPLLSNEAFACVFMAFMAISNGYLSSLAMMFGPSRADDHEKETAGSLMVFFLLLGLGLGSYTCLGIQKALGLQQC